MDLESTARILRPKIQNGYLSKKDYGETGKQLLSKQTNTFVEVRVDLNQAKVGQMILD